MEEKIKAQIHLSLIFLPSKASESQRSQDKLKWAFSTNFLIIKLFLLLINSLSFPWNYAINFNHHLITLFCHFLFHLLGTFSTESRASFSHTFVSLLRLQIPVTTRPLEACWAVEALGPVQGRVQSKRLLAAIGSDKNQSKWHGNSRKAFIKSQTKLGDSADAIGPVGWQRNDVLDVATFNRL